MRESKLEKKVKDFAKTNGIRTFKMEGSSDAGKPDRLFIYKGRCCFIEFKGTNTVIQPKQIWYCNKLNRKGTPAIISSDYDECVEFLLKLINNNYGIHRNNNK